MLAATRMLLTSFFLATQVTAHGTTYLGNRLEPTWVTSWSFRFPNLLRLFFWVLD